MVVNTRVGNAVRFDTTKLDDAIMQAERDEEIHLQRAEEMKQEGGRLSERKHLVEQYAELLIDLHDLVFPSHSFYDGICNLHEGLWDTPEQEQLFELLKEVVNWEYPATQLVKYLAEEQAKYATRE